jgi:hypothetical protein
VRRLRLSTAAAALAAVVALAAPGTGRAIIVGDGNLAWLVEEADAIAVLRVEAIGEASYFEELAFTAAPLFSLAGSELPDPVELEIGFPVWPEELGVPFEVGATVLAFLRRDDDGALEVVNDSRALLPAGDPGEWRRGGSTRQRVFAALRSAVGQATDDRQAALLLVTLSEIAKPSDSAAFTAHLDAEPWTRRAALSALLRLAPTAERVELANRDVADYLEHPPAESDRWLFVDLYDEVFDDRFAGPEEAPGRARPFLPIFRTIADAPDALGFEDAVVSGLALAGDRTDALRLWAWATREPTGVGASKGHFDSLRLQALEGLCRIFAIPLTGPSVPAFTGQLPPEAAAQERRMREAVRAEMEAAGLLAPEARR